MKINIGAGGKKVEGFISCDYDAKSNPDFLFDLEKDVFPFENNSVDVVLAHHVLEHLGDGYFHCLKELYRVCKHGAIIDIRVPHFRHDAFFADPTHKRPISVDGMNLFSKKFNKWCREQGNPASLLAEYFDVDFEVIEHQYIPQHQYKEIFNTMPRHEAQQFVTERNNVISEIHMKLIVVKDE